MTRYSIHFRQTAAGTNNYSEVAPNAYSIGDAYPQTRGGMTFGWVGGTPVTANHNGSNAPLSGRNGTTSINLMFRIDLPDGPGRYRLWGAFGALSTGSQQPSYRLLQADPSTGRAGAEITARSGTVPASTPAGVMDASGTGQTQAAWLQDGGTAIEFDAIGSSIYLAKQASRSMYVNAVDFEYQPTPLVDAVVTDDTNTGTLTTVFALEPAGKKIGRVSSSIGTQNFTIVGAAATYFTVTTLDGMPWIVTTANRLPEGYSAGLTIQQTSSDGSVHDTTLFPVVTAAGGRPIDTSLLGRITTRTYLERQRIRAVTEGEALPGYAGQTFATQAVVANETQLVAAIKAAVKAATGSSWHVIRCDDGVWDQKASMWVQKDFAANGGGLLIEPVPGKSPLIRSELYGKIALRGLHIRDLTFVPLSIPSTFTIDFPAAGPFLALRVTNCKIGCMHAPGMTKDQYSSWGTFIRCEFAEQIVVEDCDIFGVFNFASLYAGRLMRFRNNSYRHVVSDFHALSTAYRFSTPRDVFADNDTYAEISNGTAYANPDVYTGLPGNRTPHGDWFQFRRLESFFPYAARPRNNPDAKWSVGTKVVNLAESRVYEVTAVDTGVADGPPPSGVGTDGIVRGGVTFGYVFDYTAKANFNLLMEHNCIEQSGDTVNADPDGMATPNVQFVINSNGGTDSPLTVVAINNICGSPNVRGIDAVEGSVHADYNTFVGPRSVTVVNDRSVGPAQPSIFIDDGEIRAYRNIVGAANVAGKPSIYGSANAAICESGNVIVNWRGSASAGTLPSDRLNGPFSMNGATTNPAWGYPTLDSGPDQSAATFRANLCDILYPDSPDYGARPLDN